VAARTVEQIEAVAAEISAECGTQALAVTCDVSDTESVGRAFSQVAERFGRGVDILVNNAGIAASAPVVKTNDELWQRIISINLSGTFYCTRAALPSMIEGGWGRIINVASIAGKTGAPYIAAYTASKHGVLGLTRSVAAEMAKKGITVNAICPGYVETEMAEYAVRNITSKTGKTANEALDILKAMSPQNRLVTPEEVAALALLLASHEGRGITGQAINVDGGSVLY
ncbi:MAG: SDR family oxidoreductase, partial [Pyrinomonadaceae bacterium]